MKRLAMGIWMACALPIHGEPNPVHGELVEPSARTRQLGAARPTASTSVGLNKTTLNSSHGEAGGAQRKGNEETRMVRQAHHERVHQHRFDDAQLPGYPGTVHTRIGDSLTIDGEYYRIAYFVTDDEMAKVANHFLAEWRRNGYPTIIDGAENNELLVSAFYTREGLQRSVILRRYQGRTLGFSALKDLWAAAPDQTEPGLPPLERTLFRQDLSSSDRGLLRQQTALVASGIEQVRKETLFGLTRIGYALVSQTKDNKEGRGRVILEHNNGADRMITVLTRVEPELTAIFQTQFREVGPKP